MNKLVSIIATVALLFSINVNAQQEPKQKKKKAKTEKSCSTDEKKSCGTNEKKGGCCSSKKSEEKKSQINKPVVQNSASFKLALYNYCVILKILK